MSLVKLWFSIFILGLIFYPLTSVIFKRFNDKGWIFSKIIGLAITSWTIWFLSYIRVLEYSQTNCYIVIFAYGIVNLGILLYRFKKNKVEGNQNILLRIKQSIMQDKTQDAPVHTIRNIIIFELIFIACFCIWGYVRSFNQDINNITEQYMNYGIINSCYDSQYMPPKDIWYSGSSVNYYYYGHFATSFLCKISNINTAEGCNCMVVFMFTCTFILPFSIGYNLFKNKLSNKGKKFSKLIPIIVALFMAIATSLGGSLHYPIHKWIAEDKDTYSYVKEVRYIGEEKDSKDKTATDVPAYSTILGDLHAHYIDLIFSLTTIALLAQYFLEDNKQENNDLVDSTTNNKILGNIKEWITKKSSIKYVFLLGIILGIQKMTNFWDFPIYLVIISAVIITKDLICGKFSKDNILSTILKLLGIIFIAQLITIPFTKDLVVSSTNIFFTGVCSPFLKLLVKWGIPVLCIISFLIIYLVRFKKSKAKFKDYLNNNMQDLFIIIIGICAFGLIILPEIIYLKDIYGDEYKRFNTMYKLSYQAYLLFSLSTSYILFKLMMSKNKIISYISLGVLFVYITTFGYGINAIFETAKGKESKEISSESAENYLKNTYQDDYEAIKWIRENIDRNSIILEATKIGNSYTTDCRISTFTGNPTVLGWTTHEWLWRCEKDYSMPTDLINRCSDINSLYKIEDLNKANEIIDKYNINYIYIGTIEYNHYPNINIKLLTSLGEIVYNKNSTYLIKVK